METNNCKICKVQLESKRAKTCGGSKCRSKWKMQRNAALEPVFKPCKACGASFKTVDRRNNFCSTQCKANSTNETKLGKYGTLSFTSPEVLRESSIKAAKTYQAKPAEVKQAIKDTRKTTMIRKHGVANAFELRKSKESIPLKPKPKKVILKKRVPWNKDKTGIYSEETKRKMGATNKGRILSVEHKKALAESLDNYYKNNDGPNKGITRKQISNEKTSKSLEKYRPIRIKTNVETAQAFCKSFDLTLINYDTSYGDDLIPKLSTITVKCPCNKEYETTLGRLQGGANRKCKQCMSSSISAPEYEIYEYVKELRPNKEIRQNKRPAFLNRKELDIWIPEANVAIEFHGLVHHSERRVFYAKDIKETQYMHETKYLLCKKQDIKLIQIFEDEWRDKQEICKSMIAARLGVSTKIFARKTQVKMITKQEARPFLNSTHISGSVNMTVAFGLFFDDELVSALSLRGTWNKKYGERVIEIARFASSLNTTVIGGFSKLMKQVKIWALSQGYKRVLTYADCRFGSGQVYELYGFDYVGKTRPNYFYEKNGIREDRFSHKKDNNPETLETYGYTERLQNNNKGWYAIYDAGNEIFLLDL